MLIAFIYFAVHKWKELTGNHAKLVKYEMPENMSFIKLEHVRQYDHDPSMEIMEEDVEIYYSIDQGFFGSVYLVKYLNQFAALKCSKETSFTMKEEIDLMLKIGNHENIIKLLGICYGLSSLQDVGGPPPYPILEYAEFGNLRAFLRFQRNIGQVNHKLELVCITLKFIIEKAKEVAEGMHFLSTKNIVHGDLAARNILLTKDHTQAITAKISDFGLSKALYYGYYRKKNNGHLPFKWMSFEAMKG